MNKLKSRIPPHVLISTLVFIVAILSLIVFFGRDDSSLVSASLTMNESELTELKAATDEALGLNFKALLISRSSNLKDAEVLEGKFQPRTDLPVYQLSFPVDWAADPFDDRNWQFQLHGWRPIAPALIAYERNHDAAYLDYSLKLIRDWRNYHVTHLKGAQFSWYDMSTAYRALTLAYLLNLQNSEPATFSAADYDMLLALAALHVRKLSDPAFLNKGNHGIFQIHGLMALCQVLREWNECLDAREYAAESMLDLMRNQFGNEGVHLEQSPDYHFFVLNTFGNVLRSGWYDSAPEIRRRFTIAERNAAWLVDATGRIPNIGDSTPKTASNRIGEDLACSRKDGRCLVAKLFAEAGYGIVRTAAETPAGESGSVFLTCSFHTGAHKHDDELSFEWVFDGNSILTDSGKLTYNENEDRLFILSRAAHTSIDFKSFSTWPVHRRKQGGCVTASFVDDAGQGHLSGELFYRKGDLTHRREITFDPDATMALIVNDEISGPGKSDYTVWWHFDDAIELRRETDTRFAAKTPSGEMRIEIDQHECVGEAIKGAPPPHRQGWVSRTYNELTPRWSLGFTCPEDVRNIVTSFLTD